MELTGIHHLSAVTADAARNRDIYTRALGLRLVKKTVNQDDTSAYHLFYADGLASPGSDLTFFDFPAAPEHHGTRSITRTGLRVAGGNALDYWRRRLAAEGFRHGEITERAGRATLDFVDPEGHRYAIVDDGGAGEAHPWERSPVPAEHQIRGLGPITMSVPELARTDRVLREVMGMRAESTYDTPGGTGTTHVYAMGPGGAAAELHVAVEPGAPMVQPGAGGVHHVAFRIPDADYEAWDARLREAGMRTSGQVDRFYFRSLYFREPGGILFEIATDGPGFTADEPLATLGEKLSLPPFLEGRRAQIEAGLKPL
jgi:glyoxalase family protein